MNIIEKINKYLQKNIFKIIIIFLFLSPFFDLITSLSLNVFKLQFNFIIVIKMLFMLLFIYYLFFISKSKYKKISIIYILSTFIYMLTFMIVTINIKDTSVISYELQNLLRNFFFPINLVCLFNIYDEKKDNINIKQLAIILGIYILLLFIPTITKTDFSSYAYSKEGSVGWFNSTNEIGAILSIFLPFGISYLFKLKNKILMTLILLISIYTYFSLGTKVPILSLAIVISILLIKYIIKIIKTKQLKKIYTICILFIIFILGSLIVIPKTSFYKNILIHLDFLEVDSIDDLADTHIIDHFIFSERISFYMKTKDNYLESSIPEKLLGIGYIEKYATDQTSIKTIEMDYYDIFFRNGIIGFIIYFAPYLYILFSIYKKAIKTKLNNNLLCTYLSIFLIIILSFFSGHIITAPSVSIFVVMILIMALKQLEVTNENSISNN